MNRMTTLLDKIERRLGTKPLNLPDYLRKDVWAKEVICNDTLDTYSRYFPNIIRIQIDVSGPKMPGGYYLIDDDICESVEILGVRDINWATFGQGSGMLSPYAGWGAYDYLSQSYSVDDVMLMQMRADQMSLFNNGIYLDFKPPNMIKFTSVTGNSVTGMNEIPLDLLIKHADNLMTIPPTAMEVFERLAQADVARFLYSGLKYYEGLETVFAQIDIKLSDLENEASKREDVVQELRDGYVSAANTNQPIILTV